MRKSTRETRKPDFLNYSGKSGNKKYDGTEELEEQDVNIMQEDQSDWDEMGETNARGKKKVGSTKNSVTISHQKEDQHAKSTSEAVVSHSSDTDEDMIHAFSRKAKAKAKAKQGKQANGVPSASVKYPTGSDNKLLFGNRTLFVYSFLFISSWF
jgi:hypothetical protein